MADASNEYIFVSIGRLLWPPAITAIISDHGLLLPKPKSSDISPYMSESELKLIELKPINHTSGIKTVTPSETDTVTEKELSFPTLRALKHIGKDQPILDRCHKALEIGTQFLQLPWLLGAQPAQRQLHKTVFTAELTLLDDLLHQFRTFARDDQTYYALKQETYQQLSVLLYHHLKSSSISSKISGEQIPDFPGWPHGTVGTDFFSQNDIEILAVSYRVQVEHFLFRLNQIHNFSTNESQLYKKKELVMSPPNSSLNSFSIAVDARRRRSHMFIPKSSISWTSAPIHTSRLADLFNDSPGDPDPNNSDNDNSGDERPPNSL
ncbi:hypothetical protein K435DRAFT_811572 [Dendrothele bispora CBS 962.96]|uniref:Uncharacterized protein n=1 Tax=Dendrothele bispora (strain CBS 962.96) TaxID=1314807 RepID=A0A4S8KRL4_DENBC|nr:hypothetical protein K435DRAFT_811572 [Dendrothele bispora CBS 962.96]